MQGPVHEIDIIEKEHDKSRLAYLFGAIIGCSGFIMFIIGISSMPQSFPEQNEPGYASTANQEQQSTDLRKYQQASNQFKIGIGGIGLFTLGSIICFIVYKRAENRAKYEFIKISHSVQKEEEKRQNDLIKQQELQKQVELKQKKQVEQQKQLEIQQQVEQQKQLELLKQKELERQQQLLKPTPAYPGHVYYEHYPPNYRNAFIANRIYPMPLKSILKNKE